MREVEERENTDFGGVLLFCMMVKVFTMDARSGEEENLPNHVTFDY